ncbi:membrane protein insertase YidC [Seohaeicola zhoushanensis]|uniref:Membrane protein insertase YidC n=1 Tax=Seohaeicola zhoushanensis TaxID=1569283 RepID=A0A8J3H0I8_9RHOB|nr:membrane protein insertase YidC [Seohaeicola zhoushanensis]GHF63304.1 membrane protein insertase YidC [Seohaeicola zhoushanensis]
MDDQNKNLILATALSFLVILAWSFLMPAPEPKPDSTQTELAAADPATASAPTAAPATGTTGTASTTPATQPAEEALAKAARIKIDTPRVIGSISTLGGRIDDLSLKDYRETTDDNSPIVKVLQPAGTEDAYYALYGWAPGAGLAPEDVPGPQTEWSLEKGETLSVENPVTLAWDNGKGLTFRRTIAIDADYMFTVTQSVTNASGGAVSAAPYGIIARHGEPKNRKKFFILHEGIVRMSDGTLEETTYSDLTDLPVLPAEGAKAEVIQVAENGWIGFTDHFWMATLVPSPGNAFKSVVKYDDRRDIYQAEAVLPTQQIADGATVTATTQLFAGAKEWETIRAYEAKGIAGFIDSIDWGWFFFLTKPIFWMLHHLHNLIGNMGWAIIALTFILKALLFPLAYKSYVSMAKMKELQPQMEKLKEAAGGDRQKMQQGMMELYKREKVNPASGCLPILLQIPIFFSLYKVIFVTIELRHAAWFGPFQDLSAPDPTTLLNLFGLLPIAAPEPGSIMALIFIGILPLLLGISMWLQQKLNPAPTDPTQQMVFAWMPWIFMFMLGGFASGLVVYWITNNTITFTQQYIIMRSHGHKPDVFGNIRKSFSRKAKAADAKK